MKTTTSILTLIIAFSLFLTAPSRAGRFGTELEGTIQTVNIETKHATMLTKDGKTITFRWTETTKFITAATLHKGAHVTVDYHHLLLGESYVNRVDVSSGAK